MSALHIHAFSLPRPTILFLFSFCFCRTSSFTHTFIFWFLFAFYLNFGNGTRKRQQFEVFLFFCLQCELRYCRYHYKSICSKFFGTACMCVRASVYASACIFFPQNQYLKIKNLGSFSAWQSRAIFTIFSSASASLHSLFLVNSLHATSHSHYFCVGVFFSLSLVVLKTYIYVYAFSLLFAYAFESDFFFF